MDLPPVYAACLSSMRGLVREVPLSYLRREPCEVPAMLSRQPVLFRPGFPGSMMLLDAGLDEENGKKVSMFFILL